MAPRVRMGRGWVRVLLALALGASLLPSAAAAPSRAQEWRQLTSTYIREHRAIKDPAPVAYPQMADRMRTLLQREGVSVIQVFEEVNGKRRPYADLYYSPGSLYIVAHREATNLVMVGSTAYEWQVGKKRGEAFNAPVRDVVDYLLYLTDPSLILTSLYGQYLREPETFHEPRRLPDGCLELRLKKPRSGFVGLRVREQPLWFCSLEMADLARRPVRMIFMPPRSLPALPRHVVDRRKGIRFRRSHGSLRNHLVYL